MTNTDNANNSKEGPNDPHQGSSEQTSLFKRLSDPVKLQLEKITSGIFGSKNFGVLLLTVVAVVVGALLALWVVDKVVLYYLTKTYVGEAARALDLNEHLETALVLITFIAVVYFAKQILSFSRNKRLIGIAGIFVLLIGNSLVLWYATKYFGPGGEALKCYVLTRDGQVIFRERPGIDPNTGRMCRPYTPDMLERLKAYANGKRPQRITGPNPTFFDLRSGEPIIWYFRRKDNGIELYDLMGFQAETGEELLPITKELAEEYKKQYSEGVHRPPKRVDPYTYVFFDPATGAPRAWYSRDAAGNFEFYDGPGFNPNTGENLLPAARDVVDEWKRLFACHENVPERIDPNTYSFFDPATGAARVWYWLSGDGTAYEFYNACGFHPGTGEALKIVTREIVDQWKLAEKKRAEAERKRQEDQEKAKGQEGDRSQLVNSTVNFLNAWYSVMSRPDSEYFNAANGVYADQINYFGKNESHNQVMTEVQAYAARWPNRQFVLRQGSIAINCDGAALTCRVTGLLDFDHNSPERNSRSWGFASFEYVLKYASPTSRPQIVQESGEPKDRHVEDLNNRNNPTTIVIPGFPRIQIPIPTGPNADPNYGCPNGWTRQGGVCKPYRGAVR